jgi:hypothetical protein
MENIMVRECLIDLLPPPPDGGLYVLDDAGVRLMVFVEMPQ